MSKSEVQCKSHIWLLWIYVFNIILAQFLRLHTLFLLNFFFQLIVLKGKNMLPASISGEILNVR